VIFSQWNEIRCLRAAVLKQDDVDTIHDLRVASRRLRATISLFAPFISGKGFRLIGRSIRKVTRTLGVVRTIDEAIIYFGPFSESLPTLTSVLASVRRREFGTVVDTLKQFPQHDIEKKLRSVVSQLTGMHDETARDGDESVSVHLSAVTTRRCQAIQELLPRTSALENVELRHALRIAIKKWRYSLETLGQVSGNDYADTLAALKEYQSALGNLNDVAEFGLLCDTLALPLDEIEEVRAILGRDGRKYLAQFLEMCRLRPLQHPTLP
jgi:CHAD domain-containing protein